jgi:hypothetical protein
MPSPGPERASVQVLNHCQQATTARTAPGGIRIDRSPLPEQAKVAKVAKIAKATSGKRDWGCESDRMGSGTRSLDSLGEPGAVNLRIPQLHCEHSCQIRCQLARLVRASSVSQVTIGAH